MKLSTSLGALAGLSIAVASPVADPASSSSSTTPLLFQNPDPHQSSSSATAQRIPTSYESAVQGRRILALSPLATVSTVFPTSYATADEDADGVPRAVLLEHRPAGLGGVPIGLMDYIADCEADDVGNPTILAISIATSFKNADAGSNVSISVNWVPPYPPSKRISASSPPSGGGFLAWARSWWRRGAADYDDEDDEDDYDPVPYSAANLPRFSLLGYLEPIATPDDGDEALQLQRCFLKSHPDARYWLPGNRIHHSEWVRLVVTQVYWVGGFGDRAYIGWIPVEEWRNVTRQEWEAVRLPGEKKGWKEWSVGAQQRVEEDVELDL